MKARERTSHLGGGAYAVVWPDGVTVMANSHEAPTDEVWVDLAALRGLMAELERWGLIEPAPDVRSGFR